MRLILALLFFVGAAPAAAQSWREPARGTPERRALMDAVRPWAEELFGAPVEFVVYELRVAGGLAFAYLGAQRPGGGPIDMATTPFALRVGSDQVLDDPDLSVLMRLEAGDWVLVERVPGPTDAWWSNPALCPDWRPLFPEFCP